MFADNIGFINYFGFRYLHYKLNITIWYNQLCLLCILIYIKCYIRSHAKFARATCWIPNFHSCQSFVSSQKLHNSCISYCRKSHFVRNVKLMIKKIKELYHSLFVKKFRQFEFLPRWAWSFKNNMGGRVYSQSFSFGQWHRCTFIACFARIKGYTRDGGAIIKTNIPFSGTIVRRSRRRRVASRVREKRKGPTSFQAYIRRYMEILDRRRGCCQHTNTLRLSTVHEENVVALKRIHTYAIKLLKRKEKKNRISKNEKLHK